MNNELHPKLLALQQHFSASPLQRLQDPLLTARKIELWIKRDDLIHPIISGNKWRKLKYNLNHALYQGTSRLISMGGCYSNYLHALAYAGKSLGLQTQAFIRGEAPAHFNPTLTDLQAWGMNLCFTSRGDYRELRQYRQADALPEMSANAYWLPEGGSSALALLGVAEIAAEINMDYDLFIAACGTGATLAGLIGSVPAHCQVLGIAALKNAAFLNDDISNLLATNNLTPTHNWQLLLDYHGGGFAKTTPALISFIQDFQYKHGIPLEPVYTGKLLFAIFDLLEQGYFAAGSRLIVLHSGGLQGWR